MSESRTRFVEAIAYLVGTTEAFPVARERLRQAVEAWADYECHVAHSVGYENRCWPDKHEVALGWTRDSLHAECRASLLRECGLSDKERV